MKDKKKRASSIPPVAVIPVYPPDFRCPLPEVSKPPKKK